MKENFFLHSTIAGLVRALLLIFLLDFSAFAPDGFYPCVICCVILAVLCSVLSVRLAHRFTQRKTQFAFYFSSFGWFLAGMALQFLNLLTLHLHFFPMGETSNATGILLLFLTVGYFIITEAVRIAHLIFAVIKSN